MKAKTSECLKKKKWICKYVNKYNTPIQIVYKQKSD